MNESTRESREGATWQSFAADGAAQRCSIRLFFQPLHKSLGFPEKQIDAVDQISAQASGKSFEIGVGAMR